MPFDKTTFYIITDSRGTTTSSFWFEPEKICDLLKYYNSFLQKSKRIDLLINKIYEQLSLKKPTEDLGENESSLIIKDGNAILDAEYVSGIPVTHIKVDELLEFLNAYRNWLYRYENCQIPGLIPSDKLDSWVCVPREYVKEEYLAQLDKREGDKA